MNVNQIATALFANSPFTEGKPNGYLSMRRLGFYFKYNIIYGRERIRN